MNSLSGKVALVTGASRGIGAAAAQEMAAEGAAVVLAARTVEACETLAKEINAGGGQAVAVACDVADYGALEAAVALAQSKFGRIDFLINNAAVIEPIGALEDSDPAAWAESIRINLVGVYHGLRAVLPRFRAQGGGVVVNISSGAGQHPYEGWSAYCAGKAGVVMLTQSTALETGGSGIRVFGFQPGTVDTAMQDAIRSSGINPISEMQKSDHADPKDPARVIAWLCSDAAADLAGGEVSIRDPSLRSRAGLD